MKSIKAAGIGWGLIYFAMGAIKSFTLNSNDTWASVALVFGLFLLPLPISLIAVWLPRTAGSALLCCIAANVVAVVAVVAARHTYPIADIGQFIAFIVLYDLPHLFFGVTYIKAGRLSKGTGPSGQSRPVGTA
ncbi:MAG: hypothetical protein WBG23_02900 [Acidobacteriaceae bacterium]